MIYDGRRLCRCQSSLFVDVLGLLILDVFLIDDFLSFPLMMTIIAV